MIRNHRAESLVAGAVLAALTCIVFAPALDPDSVFYFRDVSQNHHPYRQLTTAMMEAGQLPLWNPHRAAGQPLLANPNALVLHPTTLLFLLFPFGWAFKLSVIGQIALAALGTWLLLREVGASRLGAGVGACAFAFSGCVLSLGSLINLLNGAAWMPLTLWLMERAVTRRFAPWGSLAALSLAVQILAGEPSILIVTALSFAGLQVRHLFSHQAGPRRPAARALAASGIAALSIGLAMIGILPGLEMLSLSERGAGFEREEATKWSLPPAALAGTVARGLFGDPTRTDAARWWGASLHDTGVPLLLSLYIGPGFLILAVLGAASSWRASRARRAEACALAGLAAAGVALILGRHLPVYGWLLSLIPPLETVRYPVKYALLPSWCAAVLAARGYDALRSLVARAAGDAAGRRRSDRRGLAAGALTLAAALVIGATGAFGWTARYAEAAVRKAGGSQETMTAITGSMNRSILEAGIVVAAVLALALSRRHWSAWAAGAISVGMVLLADIDRSPGWRVWGAPRPSGFGYRSPAEEGGDALLWGFRWDRMTLRNATAFPWGARFAFDRGNERLDALPAAAIGRRLSDRAASGSFGVEEVRLLEAAGVSRVVAYGATLHKSMKVVRRLDGQSRPEVVVLALPSPVPRIRAVTRSEVEPEIDRALSRLEDPSYDLASTVLLEEASVHPGRTAFAGKAAPRAAIVEETPILVRVNASLPEAGHVVLADTWYPGWESSLDGEPAPILRADAMFRAVAVPAGDHEVTFRYRPGSVRNGLIVSAAAFLLAIVLAVPRRR